MFRKWIKDYFYTQKRKQEDKLRDIVSAIQDFYYNKNNKESLTDIEVVYDKMRKELNNIGFCALSLNKQTLFIKCMRPGILIGYHGENINALQDFLINKNLIKKINIEEERVIQYLFPYSE